MKNNKRTPLDRLMDDVIRMLRAPVLKTTNIDRAASSPFQYGEDAGGKTYSTSLLGIINAGPLVERTGIVLTAHLESDITKTRSVWPYLSFQRRWW